MQKSLGLWTKKVGESYKQNLTGHRVRIIEDHSAESTVETPAEEVSEGSDISSWVRDGSCDILAENMWLAFLFVFCFFFIIFCFVLFFDLF